MLACKASMSRMLVRVFAHSICEKPNSLRQPLFIARFVFDDERILFSSETDSRLFVQTPRRRKVLHEYVVSYLQFSPSPRQVW